MADQAVPRVLVDKEKVEIDGKPAFRLYFYDAMEGVIIKVISFIADNDIYLNEEEEPLEESPEEIRGPNDDVVRSINDAL